MSINQQTLLLETENFEEQPLSRVSSDIHLDSEYLQGITDYFKECKVRVALPCVC